MEKKINIAELLKDCPKGMKLDCTIWDGVTFEKVKNNQIIIKRNKKPSFDITTILNKYGCITDYDDEKCVIFPKGKTTWEGFVPPCNFKNGDIVFYNNTIAIFKEWGDETLFRTYCVLYTTVNNHPIYQFEISRPLFGKNIRKEVRFATEEEKEKLFKAIRDNGYFWDYETKTLEKLPKFKVGDRIKKGEKTATIVRVYKNCYDVRYDNGIGSFTIDLQDEWELLPNKFDINTLIPFESKVLVRDTNDYKWKSAIWGFYDEDARIYPYEVVGGGCFNCCIPYEGNEHLLGTTNNCSEFYKTWED